MSRNYYQNANVQIGVTNIEGLVDKINRVRYDLGTSIITAVSNSTGESTDGNLELTSNFETQTLVVKDNIRGGDFATVESLNVSSNSIFSGELSSNNTVVINGSSTFNNLNISGSGTFSGIPVTNPTFTNLVNISAPDINSGSIDNVPINLTTPQPITATAVTASVGFVGTTLTGNVSGDITSTGNSTFSAVDINGGTIDGTDINPTNSANGSFSSISATSYTITGGTVDDVAIDANNFHSNNITIANTQFFANGTTLELKYNNSVRASISETENVFNVLGDFYTQPSFTSFLSNEEVFTTPGSHSFVVPAGVTSISVLCIGGGGAGGGNQTTATRQAGTGGGGGGLRYYNNLSVTPGETLTVVVGAGGTGDTFNDGGDGANSSVSNTSVTLIEAYGGGGGKYANQSVAGAGGTGTSTGGSVGGGNGGDGGTGGDKNDGGIGGGGGGAGGYSGDGGAGGNHDNVNIDGQAGTGGAGGGGYGDEPFNNNEFAEGSAGGVGIYGEGASGAGADQTVIYGSGGSRGTDGSISGGGKYGAGGAGASGGNTFDNKAGADGGDGVVRIIWGASRTFPNDASPQADISTYQESAHTSVEIVNRFASAPETNSGIKLPYEFNNSLASYDEFASISARVSNTSSNNQTSDLTFWAYHQGNYLPALSITSSDTDGIVFEMELGKDNETGTNLLGANQAYYRMKMDATDEQGKIEHYSPTTETNQYVYVVRTDVGGDTNTVLRVTARGFVANRNGVYGTLSTREIKEDITPVDNYLEKIDQIRVRKYKHIDGDDHEHVGYIAQEMKKVFPELVKRAKIPGGHGHMTIDTDVVTPILVQGVKELKGMHDEAEELLKRLKNR